MHKSTSPAGFSLIELMIIISIIGILSTVALPTYTKHVIKSRLGEVFTYAEHVKASLIEHFEDGKSMPASGQESVLGYDRTNNPTPMVTGVLFEPTLCGSCSSGTKQGCFILEGNSSNIGVTGSIQVLYLICESNSVYTFTCGYSSSTSTAGNHVYFPGVCNSSL